MNKISHIRLEVVKEKVGLYQTSVITEPHEAAAIAKQFIGNADREHAIVLCLNTKNRVHAIHTVSIGSVNASIVHPREVYKAAILSNSSQIIFAHNHPSADMRPSPEDIALTERLHEAGLIVGIELMDHIIVNDENDNFASLKALGFI